MTLRKIKTTSTQMIQLLQLMVLKAVTVISSKIFKAVCTKAAEN